MNYIVYRRFKDKCLSGEMNIPATSSCELKNGLIFYKDKPICFSTSQHAHQHFTRNDDGCGIYRGKLLDEIQKKVSTKGPEYDTIWNKIWNDDVCLKYKRVEHNTVWLWNHDFYIASIEDLTYIAKLIGIKVEKLNV